MKVYAILAHDNPKSLNAHIFNTIITRLKKMDIEVNVLDLYKHAGEIPFYKTNQKKLETEPFFLENKKRFLEANRILIVHPVYWYSVPGILKTWIDLITSYAYKYTGGPYAKALHKIDKIFVVNTSLAPIWYRKLWIGDLACSQLKETFRWLGVKKSYFYRMGTVNKLTEAKVKKHIKNILCQIEKQFLS